MIVLSTTSQALQAVMSASTSTAQLQLTAVYYDELPQQRTDMPRPRYALAVTTTLNLTTVTLVPAPTGAAIVRNITNIFGFNSDFTTATLRFQIGSTVTTIQKQHALVQGQTLTYEHGGNGWSVL